LYTETRTSQQISTNHDGYAVLWNLATYTPMTKTMQLPAEHSNMPFELQLTLKEFFQSGAQPRLQSWGPIPWFRVLLPYYRKKLDRSTQFGYIITLYSSKSYVKSWGSVQILGRSGAPTHQWLRPCFQYLCTSWTTDVIYTQHQKISWILNGICKSQLPCSSHWSSHLFCHT